MKNVLIWDNNETIVGAKNPGDTSRNSRSILPNVKSTMNQNNTINVICCGTKYPQSQEKDYSPIKVIDLFKSLMEVLPVSIALFSPKIDGTECYVIIKKDNQYSTIKAHENIRYKHLIGKFKKPNIGMLFVIKDLLSEMKIKCDESNTIFIGDTLQDMQASHDFKLPFLHANHIHRSKDIKVSLSKKIHWHHGQEMIVAWKNFFSKNNWKNIIKNHDQTAGGCGLIYELPNFLNRPNEGLGIVNISNQNFTQPHYHPDLEVYLFLEGHALVVVGSERYKVSKGDVISVPPFKAHYIIPGQKCVVAIINTPPYSTDSYIPLKESNYLVDFDFSVFKKNTETGFKDFK